MNAKLIIVLLGALFAASCGANTSLAPAGPTSTPLGQALPTTVLGEFHGNVTRGASDLTTITGASAIQSAGGTIEGDSLTLQSTPSEPAWALYEVSGLAGRNATSLEIALTLPTPDTQYSVGVSNFSDGVWDFLSPSSDATFHYDLTQDQSRLVSQLGNLYFVVVISGGSSMGGSSLTIDSANVQSELETPENEHLPLRGQRPSVSEGLPDRIEVSWAAVDGAASYELWRRLDADVAAWELVATQAEISYVDTAIELSTEYAYKVRAVNSAGPGGFSNKRSGFAGNPPQGFEDENDEDNEYKGAIEALGDSSVTVDGHEIAVTANTVIADDAGNALTLADLTVGEQVEVQADADGQGSWIATEIKVETEGDGGGDDNGGGHGNEQNFFGAIDSIDATQVTVTGTSIALNADTSWFDTAGNTVDATFFTVGMNVEVEASSDGQGGLTAIKVLQEQQEDTQNFAGTIDSIDEAQVTVGGTSIALTTDTKYFDDLGNAVDASFFSAGMAVEVEAALLPDGSFQALTVSAEGGEGQEQTITGNIDSISDTQIVIAGTTIGLTADTTYFDRKGNPVDFSFFSAGMQAGSAPSRC